MHTQTLHAASSWLLTMLTKCFAKPSVRYCAKVIAFAFGYCLLARVSLLLAIPGSNASPVWPPSGIALVCLLLGGARLWPAITIGAFIANLLSFADHGSLTPLHAIVAIYISLGNTAEAAIAAKLLRKILPDPLAWQRYFDIIIFFGAALFACAVSAAVGVSSLLFSHLIPNSLVSQIFFTWWLGDLCGMVVITPLILSWRQIWYPTKPRFLLETFAILLSATALAFAIFSTPFKHVGESRPFVILLLPILALTAIRYEIRGASAVMFAIVGAAVAASVSGNGLLEAGPLNDVLIQLDLLLVLLSFVSLLMAADVMQQRHDQPKSGLQKTLYLPWSILLLGCAVSLLAWHLVAQGSEAEAKLRFDNQAKDIINRIAERMNSYQQILISAAGLFIGRDEVSNEVWQGYAESLQLETYLPGNLGLGFAKWVETKDLEEFTLTMRNKGFTNFSVKPEGHRPEHAIVIMLEPFDLRNQRAFGFDMWSEPIRRAALRAARDSGKIAVSGKVRLIQENGQNEQAGFLMYHAVYKTGIHPTALSTRQRDLIGFVLAPFRVDDFVYAARQNLAPGLALDIFDGDKLDVEQARLFPSPQNMHKLQSKQIGMLSKNKVLEIGQHQWALRVSTLPKFWSQIDRAQSRIVLVFGTLLSTLLFILIRALAQTQLHAERIATRMTLAYKDANSSLDSLVQTAQVPIIISDENGFIERCNPAAKKMFGEQGLQRAQNLLDLIASPQHQALKNTMEELQKENSTIQSRLMVSALQEGGQLVPASLSLSGWLTERGHIFGAIFYDMTEQQRADEFERGMFEEGLDAMIIVNAFGDILSANTRASEMFGHSCQALEAMQIETLLPALMQQTHHNPMESNRDLHAVREDGHEFPVEIALNNLRIGNDVQFIVTIVDISARKAAEKKLQDTLAFQNSIQRNAGVSIIATDLDGIILNFNTAAERMLGYRAEEMVGKQTPAAFHDKQEVISSAHTLSKEFGHTIEPGFAALVARARLGEVDEREWTYIRKDGSRFPVRLAVTGLFDSAGILTGFLGIAADITELKRHEQIQHAALHEKETLLREVYHRVKNNLQVVSSLFNLQLRNLPQGTARETLFEAAQRVKSMALVHEKLYQSNTLSSIRLDEYVQDLCKQLMHVNGAETRNISLRTELTEIPLGLDQAVPLGLLINELLTNSIKHAFDEKGGEITVRIQQQGTNVIFEIFDNGKGFSNLDNDGEQKQSLGLRLARTLTRQIDGELSRENRNGAYTRVSFPLPAEANSRLETEPAYVH